MVIETLISAGALGALAAVVVLARRRAKSVTATAQSQDPELALHPLTGTPLGRTEKAPVAVDLEGPAPAPRVPTLLRHQALLDSAPLARAATHVPGQPSPVTLDTQRRSELIEQAVAERDVEALAAQAAVDEPSRLACLVLAGHVGRELGDPRAEHWLHQAFLSGQDPATDSLLAPHRRSLRFTCSLPGWGVDAEWPATREGLGVSVAAEELRTGDVDSAYGVLLDLPDTGPVFALRAAVAVDLRWWSRAVRASRSVGGAWEPLARTARAQALLRKGDAASARDELTWVIETLDGDPTSHVRTGGQTLLGRALFERSAAHRALGDVNAAWSDLTALMAAVPSYPGAAEAMKSL